MSGVWARKMRCDTGQVLPFILPLMRRQSPKARGRAVLIGGTKAISIRHMNLRVRDLLRISVHAAMNFAKMLVWSVFNRNSGRRWRSAVATTSSEGGMPGRMVRNQDPKEFQ